MVTAIACSVLLPSCIPLPNGLHAQWTLAALKAGLVVMEAFHYRYHPLAQRMAELVHGGELGTIQRVETAMCFPLPRFSDL
jgi:predicted dehydrogenase